MSSQKNRLSVRTNFVFVCVLLLALPALRWESLAIGLTAQTPVEVNSDYTVEEVFPGITFRQPVAIATPPGENSRLFIVERAGRIIEIPDLSRPTFNVFLDISDRVTSDWDARSLEGLSSLAFHPNHRDNGYFFVTYTCVTQSEAGTGNHNRLSRFQLGRNIHFGAPESELPLITQYDEGAGHNINDLHFGNDGYLYVAVGDEGDGGNGDDFHNSQRIDKDFFSAILRLDVDKSPGNLRPNPHPSATDNYSIPSDNPWVGATSFNGVAVDSSRVRTEFYAVGLRNPWRIWMDTVTDQLYAADVGQHKREEINLIVKGGNYGWSYREGTDVGPMGQPPSGLNLIPPVFEYGTGYDAHQGFSVIGGFVYRGSRLPQLDGSYIFADYVSGNVWSLRHDGEKATGVVRILSHRGIAGFGRDPRNGDVLIIDHDEGRILRLVYKPGPSTNTPPATLAETGLFEDLQTLKTKAGLIPYDVNLPSWSDGAQKRRWISVPANQTIGFSSTQNWTFPAGTFWVKHFQMDLTENDPTSRRNLETRVLIKNDTNVYGFTYRWENATNAVLVPEEGLDETFIVTRGGLTRTQIWHYPGRQECLACHTPAGGFALGFQTAQLNRDFNYESGTTNQLLALQAGGYFSSPVGNPHSLPALARISDTNVSREFRARSYLAVNCAFCHQPGGTGRGYWDARIATPTAHAGIIDGALFDTSGSPENRVVRRGSIDQSILLKRMTLPSGRQRMPPLGTTVLDEEGVQLLREWIETDLNDYRFLNEWQTEHFGSVDAPDASANADPDRDGSPNSLEYLLGTSPTQKTVPWTIQIEPTTSGLELFFLHPSNRGVEVQVTTNLFGNSWSPLRVPENRPFFPATNRSSRILDPSPEMSERYYRLRIFAP